MVLDTRREILLSCDCGVHIGGIVFYADYDRLSENDYYFSYGTRYEGYSRDTFWGRIKIMWRILRRGEYDFSEIILTKNSVAQLRDFLDSIDEKTEEYPDELVEAVVRQEGSEEDFPGADSDVSDSAEPK